MMVRSFNPRLRTGGDIDTNNMHSNTTNVSIHASAREATSNCSVFFLAPMGFNPRLRTGGDQKEAILIPEVKQVSIHASAREATASRQKSESADELLGGVVVKKVPPRLVVQSSLTFALLFVHFQLADSSHTSRGPSGSYAVCTPTCPIRAFQLLPKK